MSNVDTADRSIDHLYPEFRPRVTAILADMDEWCKANWPGHKSTISESYRTQARQDWLYAQGRTRPGDIVTWTLHSSHSSGLAADIVGDAGNGPTWNCPDTFWEALTRSAHAHGMQRIMDYSDRLTCHTFNGPLTTTPRTMPRRRGSNSKPGTR